MQLNPKQNRFCEEYIIDYNATQAAIRAGYSKKTAYSIGGALLKKHEVATRICDLQEDLRNRAKLTADMVIEELRSLAFWSLKTFITDGNAVYDLSKMDKKRLRPVTGIKTQTRWEMEGDHLVPVVTTELKLADKRAALEALGRHLGIFKEDNKQKNMSIKVTRK